MGGEPRRDTCLGSRGASARAIPGWTRHWGVCGAGATDRSPLIAIGAEDGASAGGNHRRQHLEVPGAAFSLELPGDALSLDTTAMVQSNGSIVDSHQLNIKPWG